jgi:hypothetical protein
MPLGGTQTEHAGGAAKLAPQQRVTGHPNKADQRDDKTGRHAAKVAKVPHELGHDRTTHDCHHNEGRSLLCAAAQTVNAEREDRRKHDRHKEVRQEQRDRRNPAELAKHEQTAQTGESGKGGEHIVGEELLEQGRTQYTATEEEHKADRCERGGALVAQTQPTVLVHFKPRRERAGLEGLRHGRQLGGHVVNEVRENPALSRDMEKLVQGYSREMRLT